MIRLPALRALFLLPILCLALVLATPAQARKVDFGDYEVHYSVFPSTFLLPEVAAANNIPRSRSIGIVNIAIMIKDPEHGGIRPVNGQVEGNVTNQVQQLRRLGFRRIHEGPNAIYFIAEYQYRDGELLTFQIRARPTGQEEALPIRFSHALYND